MIDVRLVLLACAFAGMAPPQLGYAQAAPRERYVEIALSRFGGAHLTRDMQLDRVKSVGLVNVGPTNAALSLAAGLPAVTELEVLAMPGQDFDDRGLAFVGRMTHLRKLQLVGRGITDRGMASLRGLTNLQELSLDAPITDAALAHLQGMSQLRLLDLYGTQVTGTGLAAFAGLPRLEVLCLDRTAVNDAGLSSVVQCSAVQILMLRGTRVTDAGLESLALLPNLERLDLEGTGVTERGLANLAGGVDPTLMTFTGPSRLREISLRGAPHLHGDNLADVANLYGLPYFRRLDLAHTPLAADPARLAKLRQAEQTVEHWRSLPTIRSDGPLVRFDENLALYGLYFIPPSFPVSREALDELYAYPPAALRELSLPNALLRRGDAREPGDVQKLSKLTSLRKLNLAGAGASDADLAHLQSLTQLRELYLSQSDTQVTPEGEAALQAAIPALQIIRLEGK